VIAELLFLLKISVRRCTGVPCTGIIHNIYAYQVCAWLTIFRHIVRNLADTVRYTVRQ